MTARTMPRIWVDAMHVGNDGLQLWAARFRAAARKLQMRRMYATRLMYWTARHRSIDTALWCVAFEGYTW